MKIGLKILKRIPKLGLRPPEVRSGVRDFGANRSSCWQLSSSPKGDRLATCRLEDESTTREGQRGPGSGSRLELEPLTGSRLHDKKISCEGEREVMLYRFEDGQSLGLGALIIDVSALTC
jgi:hypothetical protein